MYVVRPHLAWFLLPANDNNSGNEACRKGIDRLESGVIFVNTEVVFLAKHIMDLFSSHKT